MSGKQYVKKKENTYGLVCKKKTNNKKNYGSGISKQNSNTKIIMHCLYFQKINFFENKKPKIHK